MAPNTNIIPKVSLQFYYWWWDLWTLAYYYKIKRCELFSYMLLLYYCQLNVKHPMFICLYNTVILKSQLYFILFEELKILITTILYKKTHTWGFSIQRQKKSLYLCLFDIFHVEINKHTAHIRFFSKDRITFFLH